LRLELTATAPQLTSTTTDPLTTDTAWTWQTGQVTAHFLPYRPNHIIANLGGTHIITYRPPGGPHHQQINAHAETFMASYHNQQGRLERFSLDVAQLTTTSPNAKAGDGKVGIAHADSLQLHIRPAPGDGAQAHDLSLTGNQLFFQDATTNALGPTIQEMVLQARLHRTPAVSGSANDMLRRWAQTGGTLAVDQLKLVWGPLKLEAQGNLKLDAQGRPEGQLDATLSDHPPLLDALVKAGTITRREASLAFAGMELLSAFQGQTPGHLRAPLIARDGLLYLGPLALAPLKPLY